MKKVRFIADKSWLRMALIIEIPYTILIEEMLFNYITSEKTRSYTPFEALVMIVVLYFALLITLLIVSRRCVVIVELTKDGIAFASPFRKRVYKPYQEFPDLYHGTYWNGKTYHYIVLTNRRMSSEELSHINNVFNDENTIKISYNRRHHAALLEMLPPRQKSALIRCFGTLDEAKSRKDKNI